MIATMANRNSSVTLTETLANNGFLFRFNVLSPASYAFFFFIPYGGRMRKPIAASLAPIGAFCYNKI